jgi:hypothetical protein
MRELGSWSQNLIPLGFIRLPRASAHPIFLRRMPGRIRSLIQSSYLPRHRHPINVALRDNFGESIDGGGGARKCSFFRNQANVRQASHVLL